MPPPLPRSQAMGWPIRRRRLLACALSRESLVWLGPADAAEVEKDFLAFFERRAVVDGCAFVGLDSPGNRQAAREALTGMAGSSADLADDFDNSCKQRLQAYRKLCPHRCGAKSGAMIADLSQNPWARQRASPWIPALATTSRPVCMWKPDGFEVKVLTPREIAPRARRRSIAQRCVL